MKEVTTILGHDGVCRRDKVCEALGWERTPHYYRVPCKNDIDGSEGWWAFEVQYHSVVRYIPLEELPLIIAQGIFVLPGQVPSPVYCRKVIIPYLAKRLEMLACS